MNSFNAQSQVVPYGQQQYQATLKSSIAGGERTSIVPSGFQNSSLDYSQSNNQTSQYAQSPETHKKLSYFNRDNIVIKDEKYQSQNLIEPSLIEDGLKVQQNSISRIRKSSLPHNQFNNNND